MSEIHVSVWTTRKTNLTIRTDLREHSIFALRNCLQDNLENQQVVREVKPLRDFDKDGVLRDVGVMGQA
jgi:hypothetical protein